MNTLRNFLTFDKDFLWFAENNYKQYNFVLLSNDVVEWSKYIFELYGLNKYFKESIISGDIHMRKPDSQIFYYAIKHMQCNPHECFFFDNSVKNLNAAKKSTGINTILFNRDNDVYSGNTVYNFKELNEILKDI